MDRSPIQRPGARVILVDAAHRVLLMKHRVENPDVRSVRATPGGGMEPGETPEQAAIRELREEIGLVIDVLGPCVWLRTHLLPWQGDLYEIKERYYVSRVDTYDVGDHVNQDEVERDWVLGHRWWSVAEIEASNDVFVPRHLAALLPSILRREYPAEPFEVGI